MICGHNITLTLYIIATYHMYYNWHEYLLLFSCDLAKCRKIKIKVHVNSEMLYLVQILMNLDENNTTVLGIIPTTSLSCTEHEISNISKYRVLSSKVELP
jgi:hypothetical protein